MDHKQSVDIKKRPEVVKGPTDIQKGRDLASLSADDFFPECEPLFSSSMIRSVPKDDSPIDQKFQKLPWNRKRLLLGIDPKTI